MKRVFCLIGAIIFICMASRVVHADWVHRIQPGETLSNISKYYGMTVDTLLGNNQYITNPNTVYSGQVIIIPGPNKQSYQVKAGDTLFEISRKFDISLSLLADYNKLNDLNSINIGQVLMIPRVYVVKAGDTLYKIASEYDITPKDIAQENNLNDINMLFIGQTLFIPYQLIEREDLLANERYLSAISDKFPNTFYYKGKSGNKQIALTFDDGPGKTITPEILDVLKEYDVNATFFLLGSNMAGKEDIVKRAVAEGHTIANHTWNHLDLRTLNEEQLKQELKLQENEIKAITGLTPALMRPPYGFINDSTLNNLSHIGYRVINWTVDSKDWRDHNADQVLINTIPNIRDGSIILMHDYLTHATTQKALPEIIQTLKDQGYTFVTVDKLIGVQAYR